MKRRQSLYDKAAGWKEAAKGDAGKGRAKQSNQADEKAGGVLNVAGRRGCIFKVDTYAEPSHGFKVG